MASETTHALVHFKDDETFEVVSVSDIDDFDERQLVWNGDILISGPIEYNVKWMSQWYTANLLQLGGLGDVKRLYARAQKEAVKYSEERKQTLTAHRKRKPLTPFSPGQYSDKENSVTTAKKIKREIMDKKKWLAKTNKASLMMKVNGKKQSNLTNQLEPDGMMKEILKERREALSRITGDKPAQDLIVEHDSTDSDDASSEVELMSREQMAARIQELEHKLKKKTQELCSMQEAFMTLSALPDLVTQFKDVLRGMKEGHKRYTSQPAILRKPLVHRPDDTLVVLAPQAATTKLSQAATTKPPQAATTKPPQAATTKLPQAATTKPPQAATTKLPQETLTKLPAVADVTPSSGTVVKRTPHDATAIVAPDETEYMTAAMVQKANHTTGAKLVNDLMTCLFTPEELVNCSLLGGEFHGKNADLADKRQPLDQNKLAAMREYVRKHHPQLPDGPTQKNKPVSWEVKFNVLCRTKMSNMRKTFKKQ